MAVTERYLGGPVDREVVETPAVDCWFKIE